MATAFVNRPEDFYRDNDGTYHVDLIVVYLGPDVPGTPFNAVVRVNIDPAITLANLATSVIAQIRADAVARGFTVAANRLIMQPYSTF